MKIVFQAYRIADKEALVEIFKSNCPKYFIISDLSDFVDFLDNYADENFKVVKLDDTIVGCGGHYVKHEAKLIGIAWVMFKRFSIGRTLFLDLSDKFFKNILNSIATENLDFDIVINTTQLLEKTFNKYAFFTETIIKNGFGENLDHYKMRRKAVN